MKKVRGKGRRREEEKDEVGLYLDSSPVAAVIKLFSPQRTHTQASGKGAEESLQK